MHDPIYLLRLPLSLSLLAAASGCVPDFDTDLSAIREPKLLAISSSPAETQARKETTLTALVATPPGERAGSVSWSLCLERKPLTELGPVNPACLDLGSDAERVDLGSGESALATLDQDVCRFFGPVRPTGMAGEPAGRPVDPDITGGFYQPVVASWGGAVSLGAIRIDCDPANLNRDDALAFRRQYRANENPRLSSLAIREGGSNQELPDDAEPIKVKAGSAIALRASWLSCPSESECGDGYCTANEDATTCADDCKAGEARGCPGAEPYVWYNRENQRIEPRHEGISVAWYTSSGSFGSEQTGLDESQARSRTTTDNTWRVGEGAGPARVWLVIRDSRGGQSWRVQEFDVTP